MWHSEVAFLPSSAIMKAAHQLLIRGSGDKHSLFRTQESSVMPAIWEQIESYLHEKLSIFRHQSLLWNLSRHINAGEVLQYETNELAGTRKSNECGFQGLPNLFCFYI